MKNIHLTKVLALMLAFVMTLGTCSAALANDYTYSSYEEAVFNSANTLYEELIQTATALELVTAYEQKTSNQISAFKATLMDEIRNHFQSHIDSLIAAMTPEDVVDVAVQLGAIREDIVTPYVVSYTKVAPLLDTIVDVSGASAAAYKLLSGRSIEPNNGLNLSKTSTKIENQNAYKIRLEAYTTGSVTAGKPVPVDVVMVLDESGSMADNLAHSEVYTLDTDETYYVKTGYSYTAVNYCNGYHWVYTNGQWREQYVHEPAWYSGQIYGADHYGTMYVPKISANDADASHVQFYTQQSKNEALETAAKTLVQNVYDDAVKNNVDHRVAVIGFSNNNGAAIREPLAEADYEDIRNTKTEVDTAINNLKTSGGTYIEDGLTKAVEAFQNNYAVTTANRKRVVIVFTDGVPGDGDWDDNNPNTITASANPAINTAKTLKADTKNGGYGATVYTIGLLDNADPAAPINTGNSDAARTNRFLHYMSSNYPTAVSMSDDGDGGSNKGYYLAPQNAAELNEIFGEISDAIATPSISLDSTTTVKDIITPYFELPANTTNVTVTAVPCTGYTDGAPNWTTDASKITTLENAVTFADGDGDGDNDTVNVTGFNFNNNFVSDTPRTSGDNANFYGQKVVIEFTVTPAADFLGGNHVPTNTASAGVYSGSTLVERFVVPDVDVYVQDVAPTAKPAFSGANQHIYLTNNADLTLLVEGIGQYTLNGQSYTINGTNNAYVNLVYQIKDGDTLIGTYTIPAGQTTGTWVAAEGQTLTPALPGDKTYNLYCTVSPTSTRTYGPTTTPDIASGEESVTATVFVYKPQLTFNDSEIKYNQTVPPGTKEGYSANGGEEVWLHDGTTDSSTVAMHGTKPTLELVYTPDESKITADKFTATDYVAVDVAVKLDDGDASTTNTDITDKITFVHADCDVVGDCAWDSDNPLNGTPAFLLHVTTGELTITKKVVNDTEFTPAVTEFNFTLALTDADGKALTKAFPVKDSKTDETKTNGSTFKLKAGGSITIQGLPAGTKFKVVETEANTMGYVTTYTNADGSIVSGQNNVEVKNQYQTGSLTISKKVSGADAPADTFKFNVTLPNGTYKYQVITTDAEDKETAGQLTDLTVTTGTAQFDLKDKQKVVITGFPVNQGYTVSETVNAEYTTTVVPHGGKSGTESSLGTVGTIATTDANHTVAYTNTYNYSHLTIEKTGMTSGNAIVDVTVGGTKFQVVLNEKNGWEQTIAHLKKGDSFSVTEAGDWTWRYNTTSISPKNGSIAEGGTTVEVENEKRENKWLDDESSVKNVFNGVDPTPNN